jgi:hypothetical protein
MIKNNAAPLELRLSDEKIVSLSASDLSAESEEEDYREDLDKA